MTQYNNPYGQQYVYGQPTANQFQQPAEKAYDWNDTITEDAREYIILPEGDYDFVVESFERQHFAGSDKMPPCPKAILKIRIITSDGKVAYIQHQLLLHSRVEYRLSEFFTSIGLKKKGQPLQMNWTKVPGSHGRCKLGVRQYNGNTYNEIRQFYPAPESGQIPNGNSYTPGSF